MGAACCASADDGAPTTVETSTAVNEAPVEPVQAAQEPPPPQEEEKKQEEEEEDGEEPDFGGEWLLVKVDGDMEGYLKIMFKGKGDKMIQAMKHGGWGVFTTSCNITQDMWGKIVEKTSYQGGGDKKSYEIGGDHKQEDGSSWSARWEKTKLIVEKSRDGDVKETSKRFMTKHEGKEYMVLTTKHKRGPEFTQVWAKKD